MLQEISNCINKIIEYENTYGAWSFDDIAGIADLTILNWLIENGYVEEVESDLPITPIKKKYKLSKKAIKLVGKEEKKEELTEIPDDLFDSIIGLDDIKELFFMALKAREPVHIFLVGPTSSAKSLFLYSLERLKGAEYVDAELATKTGIGKILEERKPRYLLIDEFDGLSNDDYGVLLNVMANQRLKITKGNKVVDMPMKTWVFACANTRNVPKKILDRFLAVIRLGEYGRVDTINVIENILKNDKNISPELASYIAKRVVDDLGILNPRVAVQIAHMSKTKEDVDKVIKIIAGRL